MCPVEDPEKEQAWRRSGRVFAAFGTVGATAFVLGVPWLAVQLRRRHVHREEVRTLEQRRAVLVSSLALRGGVGPSAFNLSLSGRF